MKVFTFTRRRVLGAAVASCMVLSATLASASDWRGWNIHVAQYPVSIAMKSFMDEVSAKTKGEITGKVYNNGVLGSQPDAIQQTRLGVLDFGEFNLGPMGPMIPETNAVSLPFIFKSEEQMYRLMDGAVGDEIGKGMIAKGLVPIGWYSAGARSFYNVKHPIKTPADVKGLKLRVMDNQLFVNMVNALGGNATPMAFGEVFQSLKSGVIDGAENNTPSYQETHHYEVAKYYSLTDHLIIPEALCVSKKAWDKLTPEQQDIVMKAGHASALLERKLWKARDAESMKIIKDAGVQVNEVTDRAAFLDAMKPVYKDFLTANPDLTGLVNEILNAPN
jgi:tripartite ATP-independent transporter DctP family solute receptor